MENAITGGSQFTFSGGSAGYTGRALSRYRLVLTPGAEVQEKLSAERQYAQTSFGENLRWEAGAELLLAECLAKEEMEDTMLRWLHRTIEQEECFSVQFNNYGSMPGYPLYVRIQDLTRLRQFTEQLRVLDGLLKGNDCPMLKLANPPRLMMAKEISPEREMEVLLDFSGRCFRAATEVEELLFIKGENQVLSRLRLSPRGRRKEMYVTV